jgi:phage-related tail fiber protein
MRIVVTPAGIVRHVYQEAVGLDLGDSEIARASAVEPRGQQWYAEVGGVTLGPFARRSEAIAAEVKYVEENVL